MATDPSPSASSQSSTSTSLLFGTLQSGGLGPSRLHACSTFLAGDTTITIIPTFNYRHPLGLISRPSVGPFTAGVACPVPLWLATHLRRRNLCRIVPPSWLDVEVLRDVLKHERDPNEASFSPLLPFRHAEIAKAVLGAASTGSGSGAAGSAGGPGGQVEVPDSDQIRLLLEDIATVRMDKIRRNIHTLSAQSMAREDMASLPVIDVTGIGSLEMHAVMPFIVEAFRTHRMLTGQDGGAKDDSKNGSKNAAGGAGRGRGRAAAAAGSSSAAAARGRAEEHSSSAAGGGDAPMDEDDEEDEEGDELEEPTRSAGGGRSRLRRFR